MPLSKRAKRGENARTEVPFWRESGEISLPFSDRVLSSDRTLIARPWPQNLLALDHIYHVSGGYAKTPILLLIRLQHPIDMLAKG